MTKENTLSLCYRIFLIIFSLFASFEAYAVEYYRADTRPPEEIRVQGGFVPRGWGIVYTRETMVDTSLFTHTLGAFYGARDDSGYVSTTSAMESAEQFGTTMHGDTYYIYVIAQAPNLVDVNVVLAQYSPIPREREFAAMGRVPFSQVIGWHRVSRGTRGPLELNEDYRADVFDQQPAADPRSFYAIAGFPQRHEAWQQAPWNQFAPGGCGSAREKSSIGSCDASQKTLVRGKLNEINAFLASHRINTMSPGMTAFLARDF